MIACPGKHWFKHVDNMVTDLTGLGEHELVNTGSNTSIAWALVQMVQGYRVLVNTCSNVDRIDTGSNGSRIPGLGIKRR